MRHVVYADTLLLLNTAVTWLLLLSVRQFSGVKTSSKRVIAAAFLGGAASCVTLLPAVGVLLTIVIQTAVSASVTFCAFFEGSARRFMRCWSLFAGMTFCYGGVTYGLSLTVPGFVRYRNGFAYVRIGFWGVIAVLTACYLLILLLKKRFGREEETFTYEIEIERDGRKVTGKAVLDSGHFVNDCYTGKPVVICSVSFLNGLLSPDEQSRLSAFWKTEEITDNGTLRPRLIPVRTVGGTRMLTAFTCDRVTVKNADRYAQAEGVSVAAVNETETELRCDALIGRQFFD